MCVIVPVFLFCNDTVSSISSPKRHPEPHLTKSFVCALYYIDNSSVSVMADSLEMVSHVQVLFSPVSHVSSSVINASVSVYVYL